MCFASSARAILASPLSSSCRLEGVKDIRNAANVICQMFATNVAWTLFAERSKFRIAIFDTQPEAPFITGDQPLINTLGDPFNKDVVPDELEFFYPLSSLRAMLLTQSTQYESRESISPFQVDRYNVLIAHSSLEQVFSDNKKSLEVIQASLNALKG
jgi:hypothetical protein